MTYAARILFCAASIVSWIPTWSGGSGRSLRAKHCLHLSELRALPSPLIAPMYKTYVIDTIDGKGHWCAVKLYF